MIIQDKQFENCIKKYERLIITICLSFTKNYFDAEDIAQQTFLSAYRNLSKFDGKNFKAWITKIAVNKCRDYIKKPSRNMEILTCEDYKYIRDKSDSPEKVVLDKYSKENIYNLCNKLKEPYKTVAINYFCKDIKLSDMAKNTGQKLKTLETRLYRAKKLLAILWKEEFI
ncbi:MAG: RNA polymerase sigma factor [Clostridium sp.]|jgi:RNA polymerase sigma-70 factor, ECF subfamily